MSVEEFRIAKEINSLSHKQDSLREQIEQQEKRLIHIEDMREERQQECNKVQGDLETGKKEMATIDKEIAFFQTQLDRDNEHLHNITTQEQLNNLNKSIQENKDKISQLEEEGFILLGKIEKWEQEILEATTFLSGSKETLAEITSEVDLSTKELQSQISVLQERIDLLIEQLNPFFQEKIKSILKKKINISSFTRIISGRCEFCKFSLSSNDISLIEDKLALKTCSGCGRLFIPQLASS